MKYLPYIIITVALIVIAILILRGSDKETPKNENYNTRYVKITDITPRNAVVHSLEEGTMLITVEHNLPASKTWAIDQNEVPEDTQVGDYLHLTYDPKNPESADVVRKNFKLDIKKGEE